MGKTAVIYHHCVLHSQTFPQLLLQSAVPLHRRMDFDFHNSPAGCLLNILRHLKPADSESFSYLRLISSFHIIKPSHLSHLLALKFRIHSIRSYPVFAAVFRQKRLYPNPF